jgi:RNA polymerase sigma-70 factor (ECF subfamily)
VYAGQQSFAVFFYDRCEFFRRYSHNRCGLYNSPVSRSKLARASIAHGFRCRGLENLKDSTPQASRHLACALRSLRNRSQAVKPIDMSIAAEAYEADRRALWGLCYRMTGSAADADDIVQETFVRAMEHPPSRREGLRPWLVRVATNLSLDHLRRRKRREYRGPWLPSPLPTQEEESFDMTLIAPSADSPSARYDMRESLSFAFLLALEALTPVQRAVLLLRDVLDYSTEETAAALNLSESNVKVHLHRARRRLEEYDKERFTPDSTRATREAIERFLSCLDAGDVECIEKLLTEDAVSLSDGGGKVYAALNPIRGRAKVARLLHGLNEKLKLERRVALGNLNSLPALVVEHIDAPEGIASRFTMHFDIDSEGKIRRLSVVLAPDKLSALERLGYSNSDK